MDSHFPHIKFEPYADADMAGVIQRLSHLTPGQVAALAHDLPREFAASTEARHD